MSDKLVTTIMTVIGSALIVAGLVWPDKVDPETQEVVKTAVNEILISVGVLIDFITGLIARDPVAIVEARLKSRAKRGK